MNTAYEALLATMIFVLILGGLTFSLNSIMSAKLIEMRRMQLKVRAEEIAQVAALLLEANPEILTVVYSYEEKVGKLEKALSEANAVNRLKIGDEEINQTMIQISFLTKLAVKSSESGMITLSLLSAAPMYRVRLGEKIEIKKFYGEITIGKGEKAILINSGGLYVFGYKKKNLTSLLGDVCRVVYFDLNYPCVITIKRKEPGSRTVQVTSSCTQSLNKYLVISGDIVDVISHLAKSRIIKAPYTVICGESYYLYPDLDYIPPLTIFSKEVPEGTIVEKAQVLAHPGNFTILVEVRVWT